MLFAVAMRCASVVRRQVVAGAGRGGGAGLGQLPAQLADLAQQEVDLLLLADDDLVEFVQQVFAEAGLDLQVGQAFFNLGGGFHSPYWTRVRGQRTGRFPTRRDAGVLCGLPGASAIMNALLPRLELPWAFSGPFSSASSWAWSPNS